MSLFFQLFDTRIPWPIAVITILIAFVTTCIVVWWHKEYRRREVLMIWIVACLFLMLYSTVLGRTSHASNNIRLMPFWSIGAIQDGLIEVLYEKIYNVLFFVPYGCLLGFRSFSNRVSGFRGFRMSILIGCATSVFIELMQLITRTGTCETDDVICNTLGCLIGSLLAKGILTIHIKIVNVNTKNQ